MYGDFNEICSLSWAWELVCIFSNRNINFGDVGLRYICEVGYLKPVSIREDGDVPAFCRVVVWVNIWNGSVTVFGENR